MRTMQNNSRLTRNGAPPFPPAYFSDHASPSAAAAVADPRDHAAERPEALPRASLSTLPTLPTHHLDMPSPRPQEPYHSSVDVFDDPGAGPGANNTAPLHPGPPCSHAGSTTSASYSSAFQLRTHRTFNSEPAPRTRRISGASGHFPPARSPDRGCTEASKLSRVFRAAVHCLPPASAIMNHAHACAQREPSSPGVRDTAADVEPECCQQAGNAPASGDQSSSGGTGSGPLQPLVPPTAFESAGLPPGVPVVDLADVEAAAHAHELHGTGMGDMHDTSSEIKRGPPGSREVRGRNALLQRKLLTVHALRSAMPVHALRVLQRFSLRNTRRRSRHQPPAGPRERCMSVAMCAAQPHPPHRSFRPHTGTSSYSRASREAPVPASLRCPPACMYASVTEPPVVI